MQFYNPLGFLALLGIPILVLFYFLKQKYKELPVSSLFLWQRAQAYSMAERPWQKLKKNLLLLLQILFFLLLTAALVNPFFLSGAKAENYILVLDQSMSMQAKSGQTTRFALAKEEIRNFVQAMPPQTGITLFVMGDFPYIPISNTTDKLAVLEQLEKVQVTEGGINQPETEALLKMQQEQTKGSIYLYTDQAQSFSTVPVHTIPCGDPAENYAVVLMTYTKEETGYLVLVRVENFSAQKKELELSLFGDRMVLDTKAVTLEAGSSADVIFDGVSLETKQLTARLLEEDAIEADNIYYTNIAAEETTTALLLSAQNIFLEKIFSLLPNFKLYQTGTEKLPELSGYDLYIFDSVLPEELPRDGHILVFNPKEDNGLLPVGKEITTGQITKAQNNQIFYAIEEMEFQIAKSKSLQAPAWGLPLLKMGEEPILVYGELAGQKIMVFGFDIHNTDLPLKKEFPILMYNIAEAFFPNRSRGIGPIYAGEAIELPVRADSQEVLLTTPEKETVLAAPPFPIGPFTRTEQTGFYTVTQISQEGETKSDSFAVNPRVTGESDVSTVEAEMTSEEQENTVGGVRIGVSLQNAAIMMLLFLLLLEWWVNCRAHRIE